MLGPIGYLLWIASFLAEAYVVIHALIRKEFFRYFSLNCYMLAAALYTAGLYFSYHRYGFQSLEYRYTYYYFDSLTTVLIYFAIMELYQRVFSEMQVSKYIRGASVLLLGGTACFSYLVLQKNLEHLTTRFVFELSQNLYFVGVVLTYMLWLAVLRLRETRARLIQLVLSLGIYFSAATVLYALRNMFPTLIGLNSFLPFVGTFLPLAWAYTFTRVPEGARLATTQVASPHR